MHQLLPTTHLQGALERVQRTLRRKAVVAVLSDFVDDPAYQRTLSILARKHTVHALLVHDPLEEAIPAGLGLLELEDAETGERRLVDSSALKPRQPVARRVEALRRSGAQASAISTADDPFHALMGHFRRSERAR